MLSSTTPYGGMYVKRHGNDFHLIIRRAAEEWDHVGFRMGADNLDCIVDRKLYDILGHDVYKSACYLKSGSIDYSGEIVDIVVEYKDYKSAADMFMGIKLKI